MHSHNESSFLIPDMLKENSRFSTPRSSVGDGISTDCEADVESNMSGNSEEASPHRRKSSLGIYGIVPASRSPMFLNINEEAQKSKGAREKIVSALQNFFASYKAIVTLSLTMIILLLVSFLLLFPTCLKGCRQTDPTKVAQSVVGSKWPIQIPDVVPHANIFLFDINGDKESDLIIAFKNASSDSQLVANSSVITAIDGKTGAILREIKLDFLAFRIFVDPQGKANGSCFVIASNGIITKISLAKGIVLWENRPCSKIHSFLVIKDINGDMTSDLLIVCSWVSVMDTALSGIVLVSGANGSLLGSKIRYQLGQKASSFLMQHNNARNETCILFGIKRKSKSTVLAVRLKRLLEIATGTRHKANLVSENPLVVARNVRDNIQPAYEDISGDGVKDIGFVLQHGIISFIDGATLSLRKTIDAGSGDIIRISIVPETSFGRPLLAVLKTNPGECQKATLNMYDFRNSFHPYTISLPKIPSLVDDIDKTNRKQFIFWFLQKQQACRTNPDKEVNDSSKNNGSKRAFPLSEETALPLHGHTDETTEDLEIQTIDKDVLNSLREYVGIDDKGVTRHHKLFHLVCNYLLLRFLISYGITTASVLKDFKSTRNHLLNLSSKNLGKALTDQLKELLTNDYDEDLDIPNWFDDIENDIGWLKDVDGKSSYKVKRDTHSMGELGYDQWHDRQRVRLFTLGGAENIEHDTHIDPQSLKILSGGKKGIAGSRLLISRFGAVDKQSIEMHEAASIGYLHKIEEEERGKDVAAVNSTPCSLPNPEFDSLLIAKSDYKWVKLRVVPEGGKSQRLLSLRKMSKSAKQECPNVSMRVTEMRIHEEYLYYVVLYSNRSRDANFIMQIDKIKLDKVS